MTPVARIHAESAIVAIHMGCPIAAISHLRSALRGCSNLRAWSKIMLAIRELSRIAPESEDTAQT